MFACTLKLANGSGHEPRRVVCAVGSMPLLARLPMMRLIQRSEKRVAPSLLYSDRFRAIGLSSVIRHRKKRKTKYQDIQNSPPATGSLAGTGR